jgi:hypothetical protein
MSQGRHAGHDPASRKQRIGKLDSGVRRNDGKRYINKYSSLLTTKKSPVSEWFDF